MIGWASPAEVVSSWSSLPAVLSLADDEVKVFHAGLDQPHEVVVALYAVLGEDERERAARFHFQADREHFIVAHGLLRFVLGRFLALDPSRIKFSSKSLGKPCLASEMGCNALRFNLSHSHGKALVAVASKREVGVDLEWITPNIEAEPLAERFFSRREVAALKNLPADERVRGFFNCWTRKEAYVKATGEGLTLALNDFEVSVGKDETSAQLLLRIQGSRRKAARWSVRELNVGEGFVGALAVEGHNWRLQRWRLGKYYDLQSPVPAENG